MSTLAERFAGPSKSVRRGALCQVGVLLTDLDVADREALLVALRLDSGLLHSRIAEDLLDEGLLNRAGRPVAQGSISWHRRGLCAC